MIVFAQILLLAIFSAAQDIEATIIISPPDVLSVEGKFVGGNPNQLKINWTFLNSIAGAENLGARISDLNLFSEQGRRIAYKKLADGEYLADEKATSFGYRVNAKPLPNAAAMAHVSWLADGQGILMLGDLLPQIAAGKQVVSARIKFGLPAGWKITSGEKKTNENSFFVKDCGKAIFLVGRNWREQETANLNMAIAGEWQFSDAEALAAASEIYGDYRKLFGEIPIDKARIFLIRFPKDVKFGRWAAETRGANVTIVSADMPFKSQSAQRLHEQLRHELFHLWLPNRMALTGNYDWFYEGFTVYQALRTGVAKNQIRFEDFLDTLAQAYNFDNLQSRKSSLVESSKNRWNVSDNQIYARGMLTAFLTDVALLRESRGKRSIAAIFQNVYQKHRVPNEPADGNAAILGILKKYSELNSIIEKYVTGTDEINWKTDLETIGIEATEENSVIRLSVMVKLNNRQKHLLDNLGYNNWRKASNKRK